LGLYEEINLFDDATDLFMTGSARLMQFMLVLTAEPSMHLLAFPTITFMRVGEHFYLGITFAPEDLLMQSLASSPWKLIPRCLAAASVFAGSLQNAK
jgi:hypothetical protein